MTAAQRITLMADWWPKACRAQGWQASDRQKRLEVLSAAVKRPLTSASDLDNRDDITAVKAHLGMLANNLAATIETDNPDIGRARVLRFTIREQLKCLAVYLPNGLAGAEAVLAEIIKDKFKHGSRVEPLTLDDLDAVPYTATNRRTGAQWTVQGQLGQVMATLARSIQPRRKAAGDSLHDMKLIARVQCDCAKCRAGQFIREEVTAEQREPVMADGAAENDNEPF